MWRDEKRMNSAEADRELDAALARYGVAEPRAGLEGRILANLASVRAERGRSVASTPWLWPAVGVLTVALIGAAATMWRSGGMTQSPAPVAQKSEPAVRSAPVANATAAAGDIEKQVAPVATERGVRRMAPSAKFVAVKTTEKEPKLEQFPSPEPLSEEEKLMIRYAADDRDALLVAQARADELKQEMEREESGAE